MTFVYVNKPYHCIEFKESFKFNPFPAEEFNLNFHPLEAVSLHRDPQVQVGGNHTYLFNSGPCVCKIDS